MDLIYQVVFEEKPKPTNAEEARLKLLRVVNDLKAHSLEELKVKLGL